MVGYLVFETGSTGFTRFGIFLPRPQSGQDEFEYLKEVFWEQHREAAKIAILSVGANNLAVERLEALPSSRGLAAHAHPDYAFVQVARLDSGLPQVANQQLVVRGDIVAKLV